MDLARSVLLPIDLQVAFDGPSWPRRWNVAADANGRELLAAWRAAKLPVIHVRHESAEPGSTLRVGEPGNAFRPGFHPLPGEAVVPKSVNAAFIGTDLDVRLRNMGVDTVVAFGFTTDMCVSTTVRVGANLGYRMVMVAEACDCFDMPDGAGGSIPAETVQRVHVATLAYEFAEIASVRQVAAAIKAVAGAS